MKKQIIILSFLASMFSYAQEDKKSTSVKTKDIKEVTIRTTKKAIEQKADRTIFDFSEQEHLNTGTAMEGIKKLPGLMSSDITGMSYQGKNLAVYMDGRPLNINSTELTGFLEGLPGNAIDRIEVITSPGAEFPATGGGAILNIITSKSAKNYLTATYSGNYSFSNYDKLRHNTNQSVLLNSKNRWFGWQLNAGTNYGESMTINKIENLNSLFSDNIRRGNFLRSAVSFDMGKDRLLLNYNFFYGHNDALVDSEGSLVPINFHRQDATDSKIHRHEAVATYQKRFDDPNKKLDFKLSHSDYKKDFEQDNHILIVNQLNKKQPIFSTASHSQETEFKINYSQNISLFDKGKINIGGLYERMTLNGIGQGIKNLEYQRQTIASYAELQASKGKFDFTLGVRGEEYDISGVTFNAKTQKYDDLIPFKQYRFFPNANVQYNISPMMNVSTSYSKKIWLPSINMLNPNTSNYTNENFINVGNAQLQPTIYDNFGIKFTAFNFLFVNYSLQLLDNESTDVIIRQGNRIIHTNQNIPSMKQHTFSAGIPLPLAMFKHSFKDIMKMNPDKLNLIYLVAGYEKHDIPHLKMNGLWFINANGNFILPKNIKLNANYMIVPKGGMHYYFYAKEPINHTLNLTLSKKFLKNQLNVSLFANDIFDTNKIDVNVRSIQPYIGINMKNSSRSFGISVNYKIPTKNKLAKENPNLLKEQQEDEKGGFGIK